MGTTEEVKKEGYIPYPQPELAPEQVRQPKATPEYIPSPVTAPI